MGWGLQKYIGCTDDSGVSCGFKRIRKTAVIRRCGIIMYDDKRILKKLKEEYMQA